MQQAFLGHFTPQSSEKITLNPRGKDKEVNGRLESKKKFASKLMKLNFEFFFSITSLRA